MTKQDIENKRDEFILELKLEEKENGTLRVYKQSINKFIEFLPDKEFEIDKTLMIKYKEFLLDSGYQIKTRNKFIVVINKFNRWLGLDDVFIKQYKEQQKTSLNDIITPVDHKRMLRWSKKLGMIDMYWLLEIMAYTGIRIEELKYFTVENLESNYINGAFNKGKERTIILPNELKRGLKKYCRENKIISGYIFYSPKDNAKPITSKTIRLRLKKIARAAKINPNKIHPHAWRHLFAKICRENGIGLDELKDILGHKSIETTAIYTQTSNKEKKDKLEKIRY